MHVGDCDSRRAKVAGRGRQCNAGKVRLEAFGFFDETVTTKSKAKSSALLPCLLVSLSCHLRVCNPQTRILHILSITVQDWEGISAGRSVITSYLTSNIYPVLFEKGSNYTTGGTRFNVQGGVSPEFTVLAGEDDNC
jgi:hypothetical protein